MSLAKLITSEQLGCKLGNFKMILMRIVLTGDLIMHLAGDDE